MNPTSVVAAGALLVIGTGFLAVGLRRWLDRRRSPRGGIVCTIVDLGVGVVALADAAMSVAGEPARIALWWAGTAVLTTAMIALIAHRRRLASR